MSRPLIFVGDLLHALDELDIESAEVARDVMRMLSLDSWADIAAAPLDLPSKPAIEPSARMMPTAGLDANATLAPVAGASEAPRPADTRVPEQRGLATATLLGQPAQRVARPAWARTTPAMARGTPVRSPLPESLLDPRQERAILCALAAGRADEEGVDLARVVGVIARGEPLRALPGRSAWNLRAGVQVLVDRGAGMAPFGADATQLVQRLQALVADGALEVLEFDGCPMRGVRPADSDGDDERWRPPPSKTPVLVVSELGLCAGARRRRGGDVHDWLAFAEAACDAHVLLRTLVPFPSSRWPAALATTLGCVAWDRRTRELDVRRVLERNFG